jgi:predicted dehydrogenase
MSKVRTAIIGMGKIGKLRADVMKRHGGFEVISTCDIADGFDYADWKKCLDESKPEAVIVCTVNHIMADIVCYAIKRGIHVFCEKPPGCCLADTLKMKQAFEASDVILKYGFNHRYHSSIMEAKTLIDSELLGQPVFIRGVYGKAGSEIFDSEWRNNPDISGGGILIDQGIHMLDLLLYFLGDLSVSFSSVDRLVWEDLPTEDSAVAVLRTPANKVATLHSSVLQWKHKFDMDIMLTDGYIALNGLLTSTRSYGEERITYYRKDLSMKTGKIGNPIEHNMCFDTDNSWDYEMAEFYDAICKGIPVKNGTVADAERVMRLVEDIYFGMEN